jgi:hypothetical protein
MILLATTSVLKIKTQETVEINPMTKKNAWFTNNSDTHSVPVLETGRANHVSSWIHKSPFYF